MEEEIARQLSEALGRAVKEVLILHREGRLLLAEAEGELCFFDGTLAYAVSSHPYEPCTYLMRRGKTVVVIRSAFDRDSILAAARKGDTLKAVTGSEYDAGRICRLLACAAEFCPDCDIGCAEGKLAVEQMKALGALSPETAVPPEVLGVRGVDSAFSRARRLTERVMRTEDGRLYVRIKGR